MLKTLKRLLTPRKSPKKKSLSSAIKRANNIQRKFKKYLRNGYSMNQARYWSKL